MDHCEAEQCEVLRQGRVLLVDHEVRDLEYHCQLLETCGQVVVGCTAYVLGARLVEVATFDLIVVSQGSPAFEGRVVLDRAMEIDRRVPALVLASSVDMGRYLEAMNLGAADYLQKPVSPADMERVIKTYLRARVPA